jgi:hypothetical protein
MSKLITLAQARRRSSATAPTSNNTHCHSRESTRASFSDSAVAANRSPTRSDTLGAARSIDAPMPGSAAAAEASVTPGASRPTTLMKF